MSTHLASRILKWYARHARELPWRNHPQPYAVWISEIMLQQTRVETVVPYFERWIEHFPNIQSLAGADLQDVLNVWEGLGYYSRARNLQQAARIIVEKHHGELPQTLTELRELPGIGRYTAGAIASMAFDQDEAALDGNIRRVLSRVFNVKAVHRSSEADQQLWALAEAHLPKGLAGEYNQALMDLGALICTPRNPDCSNCPLSDICEANKLHLQEERPVRKPKITIPHYTVTAAILRKGNHVLIAQRPEKGLLAGLWEFPGGKVQGNETLSEALQREIREELAISIQVGQSLGVYSHAYTHFRITLHAFECLIKNGNSPQLLEHSAVEWVLVSDLKNYPMGKVDRQIADRLLEWMG